MKTRFILFSLFFLSLSLIGFAQDDVTKVEKPKAKIWFGPKVGLDLAHFTTDVNEITTQFGSNYQAGIFFQFGEKLYLQPEIYYASTKTSDSIWVAGFSLSRASAARLSAALASAESDP